jgi:repressor LexA
MRDLTKRQREILDFLKAFVRDHKYPPTIREIAAAFGISPKGAYDHVKALEKKGVIRCDLNRSRAIEITDGEDDNEGVVEVPILGNVAAGVPIFSDENYEGSVKLPQGSLRTGKHFALRIKGDSMRDAGILDGDLAVIRHNQVADNGDIVVAMINDEGVTLKRFFKEKNRVKLEAENAAYPPIYTQNARILGKLAHIIRRYE